MSQKTFINNNDTTTCYSKKMNNNNNNNNTDNNTNVTTTTTTMKNSSSSSCCCYDDVTTVAASSKRISATTTTIASISNNNNDNKQEQQKQEQNTSTTSTSTTSNNNNNKSKKLTTTINWKSSPYQDWKKQLLSSSSSLPSIKSGISLTTTIEAETYNNNDNGNDDNENDDNDYDNGNDDDDDDDDDDNDDDDDDDDNDNDDNDSDYNDNDDNDNDDNNSDYNDNDDNDDDDDITDTLVKKCSTSNSNTANTNSSSSIPTEKQQNTTALTGMTTKTATTATTTIAKTTMTRMKTTTAATTKTDDNFFYKGGEEEKDKLPCLLLDSSSQSSSSPSPSPSPSSSPILFSKEIIRRNKTTEEEEEENNNNVNNNNNNYTSNKKDDEEKNIYHPKTKNKEDWYEDKTMEEDDDDNNNNKNYYYHRCELCGINLHCSEKDRDLFIALHIDGECEGNVNDNQINNNNNNKKKKRKKQHSKNTTSTTISTSIKQSTNTETTRTTTKASATATASTIEEASAAASTTSTTTRPCSVITNGTATITTNDYDYYDGDVITTATAAAATGIGDVKSFKGDDSNSTSHYQQIEEEKKEDGNNNDNNNNNTNSISSRCSSDNNMPSLFHCDDCDKNIYVPYSTSEDRDAFVAMHIQECEKSMYDMGGFDDDDNNNADVIRRNKKRQKIEKMKDNTTNNKSNTTTIQESDIICTNNTTTSSASASASASETRNNNNNNIKMKFLSWDDIIDINVKEKKFKVKWMKEEKYDPSWITLDELHDSEGCKKLRFHLTTILDQTSDAFKDFMKEIIDKERAFELFEKENIVMEDDIAFCCRDCRCPEEKKSLYYRNIICSGDGQVHHRVCCHDVLTKERGGTHWKSPFDTASEKVFNNLTQNEGNPNYWRDDEKFIYEKKDLKPLIDEAEKKENTYLNMENSVETGSFWYMGENQKAIAIEFNKLKNEITNKTKLKRPAVVVEMFGGIGAGLLCLKRQGIAIEKVIFVEKDPVATFVAMHNHDNKHNSKLPNDNITYVHEHILFEEIECDLETFLEHHGPIDIVIGGPPCQDYTPINAARGGHQGEQGKYLPNFGRLLKRIEKIQKQPIFFLAENVEITRFDDQRATEEAFGVVGVTYDAQDFSPCRRKRTFFHNYPVPSTDQEDGFAKESVPITCLEKEKGWKMPADHTSDFCPRVVKANTFMASKGRLDDCPRMLKIKELKPEDTVWLKGREVSIKDRFKKKLWLGGTFSILERERLLGFREGYVEDAVGVLFDTLHKILSIQRLQESKDAIEQLDEKYLVFSGRKFKFDVNGSDIELLIGEPDGSKKDIYYFNKEEYAKHLLGNSFSIPVVEHLISPLKDIFSSREYYGYDYNYCWSICNLK